jgi:hypothetical protein
MDIIKIILEEYEKLGTGGFGSVYKKRDYFEDRYSAYKITEDENEAHFAEIIKKNQNKLTTFPKIYKVFTAKSKNENDIKKYVIIRELITPLDDTEIEIFKKFTNEVKKYINYGDEESFEYLKKSKMLPNFIEFLINLRKEYKNLGTEHKLDIHSGNIGINEDGDYVLFDF